MAQALEPGSGTWTVVDLAERFGPILLSRIRQYPAPGTATEEDVIEIQLREDRLCELVDGILVEKTVGAYESYLAMLIGRLLGNFVSEKNLGIVLGADGMMRLMPGLVRIPDVSFISWDRLPGRKLPRAPMFNQAPDLAVEVISKSNTRKEMEGKLAEYFSTGVRGVWYVYPNLREVHVYKTREQRAVLGEAETLDGGEVLPGFRLPLQELFAEPGEEERMKDEG
jgi:Uma2 family endonuclease